MIDGRLLRVALVLLLAALDGAAAQAWAWTCEHRLFDARTVACVAGAEACPFVGTDRPRCEQLCVETAGCEAIVHDGANGYSNGTCFLTDGAYDRDAYAASRLSRCAYDRDARPYVPPGEEEAAGWDAERLLWGASNSAMSPLPWLMAGFFALWNVTVSQMVVVPVLRFWYFGCHDRTARQMSMALICPHWLLGIAVPFLLGGLVAWILSVFLPYVRMFRITAALCRMERDQPQEQRAGTQLQDDTVAALERLAASISRRRGRMTTAEIWRQVDRMQDTLSTLRGEHQEGETQLVVQAEVVQAEPINPAQQGEQAGVQMAAPVASGRERLGLSWNPTPAAHFALPVAATTAAAQGEARPASAPDRGA